jgi:hypothetical protein
MDLGREPYQTELDELVEKEIAAVMSKNEERKNRKGKEGGQAIPTGITSDVDERLLLLEDSFDKWTEKMELWRTMVTKLYENQFKKPTSRVPSELLQDVELSQRIHSKVCARPKDLSKDKGSIESHADDGNSESGTSDDDDDQVAGKSTHTSTQSGKVKAVSIEKGGEEDGRKGRGASEVRKEAEVCNNDRGGLSPRSLKAAVKMRFLFYYVGRLICSWPPAHGVP